MKIMKLLFASLILFIGLGNINAQSKDAKVTYSKVVNASADDVWTVLRQMDDIDQYSSFVGKVKWTGEHGVGGERVCYPPQEGQGHYKERIVKFSDDERTYSYAVVEGVPAMGMVNNFKVVDLGYKKSLIVWTSTYEKFMDNPQMNEEQFQGFLNGAIQEMATKVAIAAR